MSLSTVSRRCMLTVSLAALLAVIPVNAARGEDAHKTTLKNLGIEATGQGALEYLRGLHPTEERRREVAALIEQLASPSFAVRESAMQQLLRLPGLPIEPLASAAEGDDPEVRWRASEILKQSEDKSSQAIYAALKVIDAEPVEGAASALLSILPLCTQNHLRTAALAALRSSATERDIPHLRKALADGRDGQRVAAAAALCAVTKKEDRDSLTFLLADRDHAVALEVARWLADQGDRRSLPALVKLLNSEDVGVRTAAVGTLRGMTGKYMGFAAYEPADKRYAAAKKWNRWVTDEGAEVKLTFPVPRGLSARGDLGGHTLVATGSKNKVRQYDASGKEIWSYPIGSWSAEKLQNGNVLIASYTGNKIVEVDPATSKVVWEYGGLNCMTAKPLANGNFICSDFSGSRVVEINREKQIVWEHAAGQNCFDCDRLPNGNTIFGCPGYVREVTPEGELVREWKIEGRLNGFQALPSGNILVANFGKSEVFELTPEGERVWEFKEPGPCDVYRLPSGSTLISTRQRIIEIGPDKNLIREICKAQYGSARM